MPRPFSSTTVLALILALLAGCSPSHGSAQRGAVAVALSPEAQLGKRMFFDASLSASGAMSCATCHDPNLAFAEPSSQRPIPFGGQKLDAAGFRNAPSLRYLARTPPFSLAVKDGKTVPMGGYTRDGRAGSLAEQARLPLLSAHEMANGTPDTVVAKLSRSEYAAEFRMVFGDRIFDDPQTAFTRALFALQQFQLEDTADFAPFTSKYDYFLAGQLELTLREKRGLSLFEDPRKGNCSACHPSARSDDGTLPLFTDFTYDNVGVPRNAAIPANADSAYFDLGLCGPFRTDLAQRKELCGAFKVPTLRNVAVTAPYFHNGRFATLPEAVEFYATRDTNPEKWYASGRKQRVRKFDDLPGQYAQNVNTTEVPYDRHPGDAPALSSGEIDDVIAFLNTLTDGYRP
jgi:cytochrome c peroxidase